MITKATSKGGKVRITFQLPADDPPQDVAVVGDFNEWDPAGAGLRRRGAHRTVSVTLAAGRCYCFRYRTADGRWFNDEAADGHESNGLGDENCVIARAITGRS